MSAEELIVRIEEILSEFFEGEQSSTAALDEINSAICRYFPED